jgi:hypothetical protein
MHLMYEWGRCKRYPECQPTHCPDRVGAATAAAPTVYALYYLPVGLMLTRIFLNELHQVYGTAYWFSAFGKLVQ